MNEISSKSTGTFNYVYFQKYLFRLSSCLQNFAFEKLRLPGSRLEKKFSWKIKKRKRKGGGGVGEGNAEKHGERRESTTESRVQLNCNWTFSPVLEPIMGSFYGASTLYGVPSSLSYAR